MLVGWVRVEKYRREDEAIQEEEEEEECWQGIFTIWESRSNVPIHSVRLIRSICALG